MTCNDLELNQYLTDIARLHPIVSHYVRQGHLGMALTESAKLEDAVRKMGWRIRDLSIERTKGDGP